MTPAIFIDPRRVTDRLFGGPHFMSGYALETPEGTRLFNQERSVMWLASVAAVAWREGFNYAGHRI